MSRRAHVAPLVVLLKGANVGGRRSFRPSVLARELRPFDVVNVGAAGTFVARNPGGPEVLRAEVLGRLPFPADLMICRGSDILRLVSDDPFAGHTSGSEIVQFVSVMAEGRPRPAGLPLELPGEGEWSLRALERRGRFVLGLYRRDMKAIGNLVRLEKVFGLPMTTRSWKTILAIAGVLGESPAAAPSPAP